MIKFDNVTKIYHSAGNQITALKKVSFELFGGEFAAIVGRSGAGKTTLIKLLIGEEKMSNGEIFFNGVGVGKMTQKEIQKLRRKIGVVYQDYKLLPLKNVRENVEYTMQVIGVRDKDIARDVPRILDIVGLDRRWSNFPEELSGGEKQRLAIARALCHRPEVIIADEPTGNLDIYNAVEIIGLLKKIHKLGATVILATHSKEIIDSLEKRIITLENGKIIRDEQKGKFIL